MKKIVWKKPDGSILVTTPNRPMNEGETEGIYLAVIAARAKAKHPGLADAEQAGIIPAEAHDSMDREYRGAWTWTTPDPVIDIDMPKARAIHMDRIRAVRDTELRKLDAEELQAKRGQHPQGKTEADIQSLKNTLCDIPQTSDLSGCTTLDDLKAAWPAELPT